jgi:hypothetical protein
MSVLIPILSNLMCSWTIQSSGSILLQFSLGIYSSQKCNLQANLNCLKHMVQLATNMGLTVKVKLL